MKHYDEKLESINIVEEKIEDLSTKTASSENNSALETDSSRQNDSSGENNSLETKPNELLVALAMHPDTPEHEWLAACDALNKRNIDLPCKPPKRVNKKLQKLIFAAVVCSFAVIGSAAGYYAQSYLNTPARATDPPYNRSAAAWQTRALNDQLATKVANAVSERGWSAATAAEQTGMDPNKVKELLDGKDNLSMEQKVKMLFAMDKPVRLLSGSQTWTRSSVGEYNKADYQEKINYYTRALNANPNDIHLLARRADAYTDLNQMQLALDDYNRCLKIDPRFDAALNNRANLYRSMGKYDLAI